MRGSKRERPPGSGCWQLRAGGAARTFRGGKREAEVALANLVAEVSQGKTTPARGRTVGTLANAWLDARAPRWSPAEVRNVRAWLDRTFLPEVGNVSLSRVGTKHVDDFYALRRRSVSEATVQKDHSRVRSMFGQGVKWGWLGTNPALNAHRPAAVARKIDPPEPGVVVRLLEFVHTRDLPMYVFLLLAADTGARLGQLCALQWPDLDKDGTTVSFTKTLSATGDIRPLSKTKGRARVVPLGTGTLRELEAHRTKMKERSLSFGARLGKTAFVFSDDPACRTPWKVDTFKHRYVRLRREPGAGPGAAAVNFHQLRHYVATQLIAAGVDVRTVADRLGHSRASTTLDMYAAPVTEMGRVAADLLEQILRRSGG